MFKRSLATALALALLTYACAPDNPGPLDSGAKPTVPDYAVNPPPPHAANDVQLDLRALVKTWRAPKATMSALATAALDPATLSATLRPGETVTESKTVNLPASQPKGDVLFSFDLTGSMGGELNNLMTNSVGIMNAVAGVITDVQFGLVSYEDYPGTFTTSTANGQACNYSTSYGSAASGDQPYRLDRAITGDGVAVADAIRAMVIKNGVDGPESYSRVLFESYSDAHIGWRSGAKRVMVNFGDERPHDCDYDAIVGGTNDTGHDPGRDAIVGTSDDLHILDVLNGMKDNGITLVSVHSGGLNALWNAYAKVTGGTSFQINANGTFPTGTDPATSIASLISNALSTVNVLTLTVCSEFAATFGNWLVSVSPASYASVPLGESRAFDIAVGPPANAEIESGNHTFDICAIGDGVEFGRQHVAITVPATIKVVDSDASTTTLVTVQEGGKIVAGLSIPPGTFGEDVRVTVQFVKLTTGQGCHDFLLFQLGRCLGITAEQLDGGGKAILQKALIVGLCVPPEVAEAQPGLDIFKFEDRQGRVVALNPANAYFLDCSGFTFSSAVPSNWLHQLAKGLASRMGQWLAPGPLMAAVDLGAGGIIQPGDGLSFFTWATPIQTSVTVLSVSALRDGVSLSGTFSMGRKGFEPYSTEQGFDPFDVTVGFGKFVQTIPKGSFRPSVGKFLYQAPVGTTTGILSMVLYLDGRFAITGSAPAEGGGLPTFRAFSVQIGHRTQGAGLVCDATGKCARHHI